MPSDPKRRVETLFSQALERRPGTEREAFLDGACGTDVDLRERVEALLVANDEAGGFLESPAVEPVGEGPGSCIGPYKLLQEIGEGGMGVVYMAEQEKPVRRKVALKVIKLGMDTKQVIARFEAERQALAMMDHPHIARVLDAGATEAGRPFFVMELVRGVPITDYCDTHRLATAERLKLFVEVCRAVQHAHQKGVIHRDLKPSNVLVTSHDGRPVPKIIDFGVAKATNQKLTERTLFTEFRQIIGTPEYMSPEQAEMSGLDVDTRTDIFALGVLLYQLLTGTTPVDAKQLRTAGYEEMTRMIREDEAPAPSTRISKLGQEGEAIARSQGSDAGALSRHFRGELDWVVLKALEKDRTRRYETAASFAEDVERYLDNRPVEAGPVSAGYRLRKFVRRNRKAVAAAAAFFLVLALGFAGTTTGFLRARAEAERSREVSAALQAVLTTTGSGGESTRAEIESVLERVRATFGADHATYAAVLDTLAERLRDTGEFEAAVELSRDALAAWKRVSGPRDPGVGVASARLGAVLRATGEHEEAEAALREAVAILSESSGGNLQATHDARLALADLLSGRGEYQEADDLLGEALEALRASPSPPRFTIVSTLEKRFFQQLRLRSDSAEATLRETYAEVRELFGEESATFGMAAMGLGNYLVQGGRTAEAEPYLREAVAIFRENDEPAGPYVIMAYDALFQILRARTDPESVEEATQVLRETIELGRDLWGTSMVVDNLRYYANWKLGLGDHIDAIDAVMDINDFMIERGVSFEERQRGRHGLAEIALETAVEQGLAPETYARARDAIERAIAEEPDNPAMIAVLGAVLYRQGEYETASETLDLLPGPLSRSRHDRARELAPVDHAFGALVAARLGDADRARAQLALFRAGLDSLRAVDGDVRALLPEVEAAVQSHPDPVEGG